MALLNGIVLLVTAGRPSRMFDLPTVNGGDDGVPIHDSAVEERTATRVARSQVLFLGVVCFGVLVYELFGWTFLD